MPPSAARRAPAAALLVAALALAGCPSRPGPQPGPAQEAERALAEGRAAWPRRADPAALAAALEAFRRAEALRPGDAAAALERSRAEAFRALAAGGADDARAAHGESARAAERALAILAPAFGEALRAGKGTAAAAAAVPAAGAEPLYRLAVGQLGVAQATGAAAVLAVAPSLLPLLERADALDGAVDEAGPARALGAWAAALPSAAGGGAERSRGWFDRAARLAPDDPWRRVEEARTLAVLLQDGAAFDRLLAEAEAAPAAIDPSREPERALARRRARALLDKRAALF